MKWIVLALLLAPCLSVRAVAGSIDCTGIDDSATTYFPDSDTSSTTTTDKNCTVSIGGVSASNSSFATSPYTPDCVSTLGKTGFAGIREPDFLSRIAVPYIASLSVPDFPQPEIIMTFSPFTEQCLPWAESVMTSNTNLAEIFDLDDRELREIGNCVLSNDSGGQGIECEQRSNQTLIRFSSPFGNHVVSLPRPQ